MLEALPGAAFDMRVAACAWLSYSLACVHDYLRRYVGRCGTKVLNITKILLRTTYIYLDSIYKYEGYGEESLTVYSVRHYN